MLPLSSKIKLKFSMFSFLPSQVLRSKAGLVTEAGGIVDEEILGAVLVTPPTIPAGMTGFRRNPLESAGMRLESAGMQINSTGMQPESAGIGINYLI